VVSDSADVTSSVRSFHVCGLATGKDRLPTVDSLLVGTSLPTRRLVSTERSDRRLSRSATREMPRYPGASRVSRSPYVKTAILNSIL